MKDSALSISPTGKPAREDLLQRIRRLWASYLSTLSEHTRKAYTRDLRDFARHLGAADGLETLRRLIEGGPGEANTLALDYKGDLLRRGLSPQTINRRLAAIRSLVKLANTSGMISWELSVRGEKAQPYRDTRGPGRSGYQRILKAMDGSERPREIRDGAILHLLYDLALRRGELARLDLSDVDPQAGTLKILGKGRREPEILTLPEETKAALSRWIETRGGEAGPLFWNYDRRSKGARARLSSAGIYDLVLYRAAQAGIKTGPHGLRHAAITEALELTNGNLAAVRDFSRHKSYEVLRHYDDNRGNRAGEVAKLVAKAAAL